MNSLLLRAWLSEPDAAGVLWQQWRKSVDVRSLDASTCFLLPLLRPGLDAWLAEDSAGPLLMGICKQAWSGNQLRLRNLQILWQAMVARGIRPVVVGAAASALQAEPPAVLPIVTFEIMVPPNCVAPALEEGARLGWSGPQPDLRRMSHTRLSNGRGDEWCLRWRRLTIPPDLASEADAIPVNTAEWMGTSFTVPAPEWQLLEALVEEPYTERPNWLCEALLALRQPIDWSIFSRQLDGVAVPEKVSDKLKLLTSLRQPQIPQALLSYPPVAGHLSHRIRLVYRDYRLWRSQRPAPSSLSEYLCQRWEARSTWQLPLLAIRAMALHFRIAARQR